MSLRRAALAACPPRRAKAWPVALPCTAVSYIAAVLVGHFHFGLPLGMMHIAAVGLIGAGVVMLALA